MKTINSGTRQNAMLFAALWTLIPMLLSAAGVFIHCELSNQETTIKKGKLSRLEIKAEKDSLFKKNMLAGVASLDSLFGDFEQKETKCHDAMNTASPGETTLFSEMEAGERGLKSKIEALKREVSGSGHSKIYLALLEQHQKSLNFKHKIRETWKLEVPPSSCPECEERLEQSKKETQEMFAKYLDCMEKRVGKTSDLGTANSQTRQLQTEKIVSEKEKADLRKEVQQWQKIHNDLVVNLKEVLSDKDSGGKKKVRLSKCEDKVQMIEGIVRSTKKIGEGNNASYRNN